MRSLGGRMDFGAVTVDPDEPVFRARWEAAVIAAAPALLTAAPAGLSEEALTDLVTRDSMVGVEVL
jgi:hypothetical protein